MPVKLQHDKCPIAINVIFKVDTGSPITTLTEEAIERLYSNCPRIENTRKIFYRSRIAGRLIEIYNSVKHYHNLNILGVDFMQSVDARLTVDYSKSRDGTFSLKFDVNGEVKPLENDL